MSKIYKKKLVLNIYNSLLFIQWGGGGGGEFTSSTPRFYKIYFKILIIIII